MFRNNRYKELMGIVASLLVAFCIFLIILFPREILETTKTTISLWANVVLPSLLPFFIGAEILIGLGIVRLIGTLLEPIMKRFFKVPGEASFIFAMSIISGYPMGIKIASRLETNKILTTKESQRIICFASTSGPLFIFGAVGIGMFNSSRVGYIIATGHYLGAVLLGLIIALFTRDQKYDLTHNNHNIIMQSIKNMQSARKQDGRTIGQLLSDAVRDSINTQLLICGIMVVFSVLLKEIQLLGIPNHIASLFSSSPSESASNINLALYSITEITTGCKAAASSSLDINLKVIITTMIISWSGLSIHAQSSSVLAGSNLCMKKYILSKIGHTFISGFIVFIITTIIDIRPIVSVFNDFSNTTGLLSLSHFKLLSLSFKLFLMINVLLLLLGLMYNLKQFSRR